MKKECKKELSEGKKKALKTEERVKVQKVEVSNIGILCSASRIYGFYTPRIYWIP
jgi:hypothetical protein